jgi:hypothetical protein
MEQSPSGEAATRSGGFQIACFYGTSWLVGSELATDPCYEPDESNPRTPIPFP